MASGRGAGPAPSLASVRAWALLWTPNIARPRTATEWQKAKKKRENKWDFVSYRTCVSYFPGTLMKKYSVGSFAKSEFLSSSALVDSNPKISQKLSCLHSCLGHRSHRHQFGQCNSVMLLQNGQCRLGYQVRNTSISFKKIPSLK